MSLSAKIEKGMTQMRSSESTALRQVFFFLLQEAVDHARQNFEKHNTECVLGDMASGTIRLQGKKKKEQQKQ